VTRGTEGDVLTADRVPVEWWDIDADLQITVNGAPVGPRDVILFAGPDEGLCHLRGPHDPRGPERGDSVGRAGPVPRPDR
jgi:hypothetical protein